MLDLVLPERNSFDIEIQYWKEKLRDVTQLHIPSDFIKSNESGNNRSTLEFNIGTETTEQLKSLSNDQGVELITLLLSAFKVLMFRYSNQEDVCVCNTVSALGDISGRNFNTVALRTELTGDDKFIDILKRIDLTILEACKHQSIPFEDVINAIDPTQNNLFRVMFAFVDQNKGVEPGTVIINKQAPKYDLSLVLNETASGISAVLEYAAAMYRAETIERMVGHYRELLQSIINEPNESIGALQMLTSSERKEILYNFNDTLTPYPSEKTIVDLFEERVKKAPGNIALRQREQTMSYREVNEKANQLAGYLVEQGVKEGDNIGLIVTRGFNMIIGMYGIMKAGGAYVPIDPEYPIDRQEYILHNSFVTKVVSDGDYPLEQLIPAEQFVKLNKLNLSGYSKDNPGIKVDSKQLAYTIYTSGSTGKPKGVMIEHHSAVNLILWVNTEFNIGSNDRVLFITSMCFDLSVYDIFGILTAGGSVVIVEQQELMDVPKLKDMLVSQQITFWDSVPTTMDYLVRELESQDTGYLQHTLRVVFMSGDWIPVNLPDRIKKYFPKTRVISLGGATEGTVWSNFYPVEKVDAGWSSIPYGRPMANNFFYILNEQLQPTPIGVPGELYIGGVGVARGYANDKEKTDYSFVKDPFNDKAGGRMYRTGDLGRMLPGMNMEFIGRRDDQVKIRGYRIELGEIESVLRQSEMISQAIVLARADKEGKKRLVSYVVGKNGYDREAVLGYLRSKLPDYMVPTLWVELDSLPLTSNGKIDKKALPDFDAEEQLKSQYIQPMNESEKMLTKIWEDVLKTKNIGINDNFFDIGGHSLLAIQIVTKIESKTGKLFPIAVLFEYPTIQSLSNFIQADDVEPNWKSLVPIKASGKKVPIYIVHGEGLNVLSFNNLAALVDSEQPVYGLQAKGLDGIDDPLDNIVEIAKYYLSEVLEHNPKGPYAIAGYSIGGFIAVEMVRQLNAMNRKVKMLAIFDTDAESKWNRPWRVLLPKKLKRYLPKFLGGSRSLTKQIIDVTRDKLTTLKDKVGLTKKTESGEFYVVLNKIKEKHFYALNNHKLTPFSNSVHLFKAKISVHYNDDDEYLGWKKFALKGVRRYMVPGDHLSMLAPPNVAEFAEVLQNVLDNN